MWRPHASKNARFEMEVGKPRETRCGLDMCLTLRSLVSRLDPFLLGINICFQLRSKDDGFASLRTSISKWMCLNQKPNETNLGYTLLQVRHTSIFYQAPRQNWCFRIFVASPSSIEGLIYVILVGLNTWGAWPPCYTKYIIKSNLQFGMTQSIYCNLVFYQQMLNWLFGHYRILTTLLSKKSHQQSKDATFCKSK